MTRRNWLFRRNRGTAAVEFAMVAPVFVLLLFGVIVYGIFFAIQIAVVVSASEGARASLAGLSDAERSTLAGQAVQAVLAGYAPLIAASKATVSVGPVAGNSGRYQVTVGYPIAISAGFIPVPSVATFTATVSNGGY